MTVLIQALGGMWSTWHAIAVDHNICVQGSVVEDRVMVRSYDGYIKMMIMSMMILMLT